MKQTTVFRFTLVLPLLIAFQTRNKQTKKRAIKSGNMQATKVLTTKMELMKKALLKSAKKQSNEIMVSVVYPNTWPAEKLCESAFGNSMLKFIAAEAVWV